MLNLTKVQLIILQIRNYFFFINYALQISDNTMLVIFVYTFFINTIFIFKRDIFRYVFHILKYKNSKMCKNCNNCNKNNKRINK